MPIVHCIRWREADADAKFARRIFGDSDECRRTRQRHLAHFILSSFPRDHAREKSHHPTERVLPRPANIVIGRGCTGVVDRIVVGEASKDVAPRAELARVLEDAQRLPEAITEHLGARFSARDDVVVEIEHRDIGRKP